MAGRITTNQVQLGDSATASQNFHLQTNVDGTLSLNRGNVGTPTQEILRIAGTESVMRVFEFSALAGSGTSLDFITNFPIWAKEIEIGFAGLSTNGTNNLQVQLGTAGAYTVSGYSAASTRAGNAASSTVGATSTVGFNIAVATAAGSFTGTMKLVRSPGTNAWASSHSGEIFGENVGVQGGGTVTLAGVIDRIRIIGSATGAPTDTFDAGSVWVLIKG